MFYPILYPPNFPARYPTTYIDTYIDTYMMYVSNRGKQFRCVIRSVINTTYIHVALAT